MGLDQLRVAYQELKDAHDTVHKTYRAIIQRIDEIEISSAAGTEEDNIFVIASAQAPLKKAKPKRLQAIGLAFLLGPMLGVGLAFFLQYLDTTVKTREDVEQATGLPVLGYVPALREEVNGDAAATERSGYDLLAVERPRSALAEAFRSLRTALSFSTGAQGIRSLLVTSPSPLEGKSLVSINLALTFAQAGKRVLLVDSDLRKPRIHKTFGLSPTVGLSNLLTSEDAMRLDEVVQPTQVENLYVLPSGPRPPNPAELLATERMRGLLREMEERFDRVIFDTPPVVNVTDATILMHFVGGGLVVVRGFTTQRELAQRASELLQGTQGRMLGVILNNADTPRGAYGYEGYYYYSSYYYYYGDSEEEKNRGKRRSSRRKGVDEKARAAHSPGAEAAAEKPAGKPWRPWGARQSEGPIEETTPTDDRPDLPV
jgi:capsular exopolysaccharide synthesis family protein